MANIIIEPAPVDINATVSPIGPIYRKPAPVNPTIDPELPQPDAAPVLADIIPTPPSVAVSNTITGNSVIPGQLPAYLTVLSNGTIVVQQVQFLNFKGDGVAVAAGGALGSANITITGGSGNYGNANVAAYLPTYSGNISASYFIGNGALLTGITASADTGSIGFVDNTMYDLNGLSVTNGDLSHGSTSSLIIPSNGNTSTPAQLVNTYGNIALTAGSSPSHLRTWSFNPNGALDVPKFGDYDEPGRVRGDGLQLRGDVNNGGSYTYVILPNNTDAATSGATVGNDIGNVLIWANGYTWTFDKDGILYFPGNADTYNAKISSIDNGSLTVFGGQANGSISMTARDSTDGAVTSISLNGADGDTDRVYITTYNAEFDESNIWTFNTAGDFTTPGGNIFFGNQANNSAILPSGDEILLAADRGDPLADYIRVSSSGINLLTSGSTADITIQAGDDITLRGGNKISAPQTRGGDIFITPGQGGDDGGAGAGDGGYVEINGGDGGNAINGGAGGGGDVRLTGGYGGTANVASELVAGTGGTVIIQGGQGGDNDGDLGFNAPGGNVDIYGGSGSIDFANNIPSGTPGDINLYGGNWGFNFVPSGNINITTYNGNDFINWKFDNTGNTLFPGLNTARGDTTNGTLSGFTLRMGDGSNEAIITTPDGDANIISDSQRIVINPGKGADGTGGEGGDIYLWAGRGGSGDSGNAVTGGSGGDIKIRGGQGMAGGDGGYIRMEAGDTNNDNATAGFIEITAGYTNGGNPGTVTITGGVNGDGAGGDVNIHGGQSLTIGGGNVNIGGGVNANGTSWVVLQTPTYLPPYQTGGGTGEQVFVDGARTIVPGIYSSTFQYAAEITSDATPTIAYTASTPTVISTKITFAVQSTDGVNPNFEQFDVSIVKDYNSFSAVNFVVSNRVSGNVSIENTSVSAERNVDDIITVSLTLPTGRTYAAVNYTVTEFNSMII